MWKLNSVNIAVRRLIGVNPQQHRAVVYIKNSFTYIHINISSSARRGRGGDNLRQSKKSLIIQINALEDRVKSLTQQLITVANKPPLKIPMKGYYWKFNTETQIWELKPFDWLTIDDIRQLNGLEKEVQRHK